MSEITPVGSSPPPSSSRGKFPEGTVEKIRAGVNIVDIVGEHVVLRKSGSNYTGLCPFHGERSPSFSVSEGKQLYHCYGCKRGGDLFSFVMEIFGISFPEAIEELAEKARIPLAPVAHDPGVEQRREAAREKIATARKLTRFVAAFYRGNLKKLAAAESYLKARGVDDELERSFYLGGALPGWDSLARHLVEKKAPLELAVELGLIRPSTGAATRGMGYFDLFRGRVMFPILDNRGKVVGFGGRILPGIVDGSGESDGPKYMNSTESMLFQKSKVLYGLYQAQKHIREKDEVILVEGYFDVLAMHAGGFQNAVACCGTSLTAEHLAILRRFAGRIKVLFDSDKAGIAATERAMELGLDHGLVISGARLPDDRDPDEILFDQDSGAVIPDGKAEMQTVLDAARPLLDARIDEAVAASREGPEAKAQSIKRVAAWLARFNDPVGREVRAHSFLQETGISRHLFEQAGFPSGGAGGGAPRPMPRGSQNEGRVGIAKNIQRLSAAEKLLLGGLARGGEPLQMALSVGTRLPAEQCLSDLFEFAPAREWVRIWQEKSGQDQPLSVLPEQLTQGDLDPQVRSTLTETLVAQETPFSLRDFQYALERAIARSWARFSQRIKLSLADAEAKKDAGLQAQLMKEYLDVQRKMKEFNRFYDEA